MMKGIDIEDLARKIKANQAQKFDLIADTAKLTVQAQADKVLVMEVPDHGTFPIQPIAHSQIGARTQIPAKYYDRMRIEAPDLLATNVNAWFRINPEKRMLRMLGGDNRAFLSNRYQRIENDEIAEVALPILFDLPGVEIPSCEVTDSRLYIHFTVPTIRGEVRKGDVVQAGGIISNSEVGLGSVSVAEMIWRLVCLNGMKTGETFRRYHVGRQVDSSEALWAEDTQKADDRAVLLKVRDMVRAVVDETRFRSTLDRLRGLNEGKVTGDPAKAIEVLAQKIGATEGERGGILTALIEGGDLSRWGLLNAVTAQAHRAKDYDRAVEFEAMGGALIDLPKADWKEILEAA
jgi:Domain of unknown function (DUF932)